MLYVDRSNVRNITERSSVPPMHMDIGALPRRCRPFSFTESGPLRSMTKHSNGVRVLFSPSAHERQSEALGFMDRPFQVPMTRFERRFGRLKGESFDMLWSLRNWAAAPTPRERAGRVAHLRSCRRQRARPHRLLGGDGFYWPPGRAARR